VRSHVSIRFPHAAASAAACAVDQAFLGPKEYSNMRAPYAMAPAPVVMPVPAHPAPGVSLDVIPVNCTHVLQQD